MSIPIIDSIVQVPQKLVEPIVPSKFSMTTDEWKSRAFLVGALILFLVLFIWAWVSYDPDQRIFTLYKIAQGQTYDFPRFAGQILIHDGDQKGVTEWLVGGEVAKIVGCSGGCSDLSDPSSGKLTYNAAINGYTWTQTKWSSPTTYTFITNRIVKSA
jgi:hypothetical protein